MKKKYKTSKLLIGLLALFLVGACQVLEVGVPGVVGLATYPFQRLVEAFQDGVDDFHEATLKSKEKRAEEDELRLVNTCYKRSPAVADIEKIKEALQLKNCLGCEPQGQMFQCTQDIQNCCTELCEDRCERMCPETFEILSQARERSIPYKENQIDIGNSATDFGDPIVFGGYCHGNAAVRRNIATLAQFDKTQPIQFEAENEQEKFEDYYGKLIENIVFDHEVKTIPGFANMYEFTSDDRIRPLIQQAIQDAFIEQNFHNPFLVESLAIVDELDKEEFEDEIKKINMHIEAQGSAQITFGMGGASGHTVEVYHTEKVEINGEKHTRMCIIDSNTDGYTRSNRRRTKLSYEEEMGSPPRDIYCPQSINVKHSDWSYTYYGIRNSSFHVDRHSDRMLRRNIQAVKEHCEKERGCD